MTGARGRRVGRRGGRGRSAGGRGHSGDHLGVLAGSTGKGNAQVRPALRTNKNTPVARVGLDLAGFWGRHWGVSERSPLSAPQKGSTFLSQT